MKKKIKFLLLTKHTDEEITAFLQTQAELGWWLKKNSGNYFFFEKKPYEGKRICAYTFFSHGPETSTEIQLRQELPYLRKLGWDMICISGPENIADTRRHAFLYDEKPDTKNPKAIPQTDEDQNIFASKRGIKKAISNLVLCLLYATFFLFIIGKELLKIVTKTSYLIMSIVFFILLLYCLSISFIALSSRIKAQKDAKKEIRTNRFRALDIATNATFIMLLIFCLFLLQDYFYGNNVSRGTKVKINNTYVRLYSDPLPIELEDLELIIQDPYRTKRYLESESILASYRYGFDESFGSEKNFVSFISYTVFTSNSKFLNRAVEHQLYAKKGEPNEQLASQLEVDDITITQTKNLVLITKGSSLLFIKSGFPLSQNQLKTLSSLL